MSRRREKARPCPTATKAAYPDRIAAELHLARIRSEPGPPREKTPVRAYRCECRRWHLTSRTMREKANDGTDGERHTIQPASVPDDGREDRTA